MSRLSASFIPRVSLAPPLRRGHSADAPPPFGLYMTRSCGNPRSGRSRPLRRVPRRARSCHPASCPQAPSRPRSRARRGNSPRTKANAAEHGSLQSVHANGCVVSEPHLPHPVPLPFHGRGDAASAISTRVPSPAERERDRVRVGGAWTAPVRMRCCFTPRAWLFPLPWRARGGAMSLSFSFCS